MRTRLQPCVVLFCLLWGGCAKSSDQAAPASPLPGEATKFICGDQPIEFRAEAEGASLRVGRETFAMQPVVSASGAKYEAEGDVSTMFWNKGDRGLLSVRGRDFPECVEASAAQQTPETAPSLRGEEWLVEDLDGGGVIDRSRISLRFGEDGRLAGLGGCNHYSASYEQEADKLSFGPSISTRMACAPALMDQESRFFRLLEQVERFEFDSTGALILHGADGGTILARR